MPSHRGAQQLSRVFMLRATHLAHREKIHLRRCARLKGTRPGCGERRDNGSAASVVGRIRPSASPHRLLEPLWREAVVQGCPAKRASSPLLGAQGSTTHCKMRDNYGLGDKWREGRIKHGFIDSRWCLAHLIPAADKGDGFWGRRDADLKPAAVPRRKLLLCTD